MESKLLEQRHARLRRRVLTHAAKLFKRHGIREVTMAQIAIGVPLSKRTLYKLFADKEALVLQCLMSENRRARRHFCRLQSECTDTFHILFESARHQLKLIFDTNPLFFRDLRFFPAAEQYLDTVHEQDIAAFAELLRDASRQGLIRTDLDYELSARSLLFMAESSLRHETFSRYPRRELMLHVVFALLRGFSTSEGVHRIDHFLRDFTV